MEATSKFKTLVGSCILIDYEKLCHLAGYSVFERFQKAYLKWVNAALTKAEPPRETRWTEAITVGEKSFVGFVKKNQMHELAITVVSCHPNKANYFGCKFRLATFGPVIDLFYSYKYKGRRY